MFPKRKKAAKFKFRRTPPPNYSQRSTKIKVFALVAAAILILAIAERSRDPKSWEWFWRTPQHSEQLKHRLQPKTNRATQDPPGTIVQTSNQAPEEPTEEKPEAAPPTPDELAWRQGWKEIYPLLDPTERTLLFEILAQGRGVHQLDAAALDQAGKLILELDENWNAYGESAFQSLTELKADERATWEKILRATNERWTIESRPALEAAAQGAVLQGEQLAGLNRYQHMLDRLTLNLVKDDTALRPDEKDIWFRLMKHVKEQSPAELQRQQVLGVSYLQMFKQSPHYRGDVVSFRGLVRGGWRAQTVNNPWGMTHYYSLWIHPHEGPNAPVIVHLHTLPEGFPVIKERGQDGKWTELHQDVTVTGYFFKRQAYLGADGTYTAPLLLANTVEWDPATSSEARAKSRFEMTLPRFLWIAAATLAASMLAGGLIYWRIREQEQYSLHDEDIAQADMSKLNGVQLTPSVAEGLKQLEQQQGRKD